MAIAGGSLAQLVANSLADAEVFYPTQPGGLSGEVIVSQPPLHGNGGRRR